MQEDNWLDEVIQQGDVAIPKDEVLMNVAELAQLMVQKEADVEAAEERFKELKEELRVLSEFKIPQAMQSIGMTEFKIDDGEGHSSKVTVRPFYTGRITDDAAYIWMEENGYGDLPKRNLIIPYDPNVAALLADNRVEYEDKRSIHHMTLGAFIKERALAKDPVDPVLFNVYSGFRTSIK